jgi:hypothetical protein
MLELHHAVRASEILIALALIQQSLEHLANGRDRRFPFGLQLLLSLLLFTSWPAELPMLGLVGLRIYILAVYQGPYNGGSDRMAGLVLLSLLVAEWSSTSFVQEIAMGYLALQLLLSYFQPGVVKVINSEWRSGEALGKIFQFSNYPTADNLKNWGRSPKAMLLLSWMTISFELLFPLTLLHPAALQIGLALALVFHLINAMLFGLNRFFWVWPAAYPALIWFQARVF